MIVLGAGIVAGFFAFVSDIGYRRSPEYKTEHQQDARATDARSNPDVQLSVTCDNVTP
jgi:hypothetical protein